MLEENTAISQLYLIIMHRNTKISVIFYKYQNLNNLFLESILTNMQFCCDVGTIDTENFIA